MYRARVLLNVLYDDVRYWDDNCSSSQRSANPEMEVTNAFDNDGISLYPNPSDGNMMLTYSLPTEKQGQFMVYDVMGNTVAKTSLENGLHQKQIDLSQLASGVYYYKVSYDGLVIKNDKIIIVK